MPRLRLEFPDGSVVDGRSSSASSMTAQFFSHHVVGRLVLGPWSQALSDFCGQPLRLLETGSAVDRGAKGAGEPGLARLAASAWPSRRRPTTSMAGVSGC